ncbi:MAG: ABC transporter ATP-binding protein [Coriobacteriia bacterium]
MLKKIVDFLNEFTRIKAIRRMLTIVDIKKREIFGLVGFAVAFAVFEGVGLSLLLPILQYAEGAPYGAPGGGGQTSILASSGLFWKTVNSTLSFLHLPITLPVLLALAFIPILLRQVVYYFNTWYSAVVSGRIGLRMRVQTLDTVLNADPEFFTRHAVGDLVGVVIGQTTAAGTAILSVIKQLSIVLLIAVYIAILFAMSVPLTLTAVIFAGLVSVVIKANLTKIRDFGLVAAKINQEMMGKIVERFGMMTLIKIRDQADVESKNIEDFSETMRDIGVKQARLGANIEVTADPVLMLSVFVTLYIGIAVLGVTLAQLGLLLFILNRLNAKVKEFNQGRQAISLNVSGLSLVMQLTADAAASHTILSGAVKFKDLEREIVLYDVEFEFPDRHAPDGTIVSVGKQVLKGVSATIPAGSFTAIVGHSGAGKSTLVELLPRLRDVNSGTITFDGVGVREFDVGSLRKGIGYLTQSAMLFNDSVRENLVYGLDFEPTEEQIKDALDRAYASFVYDLPHGLETNLGDRGVRFSGGERQRIGLARVLLDGSSVLILDEPTSALDSQSEAYIQEALGRLRGEKTIIVIAHRLATVIKADQLLVVDEGRIVERGTHEELVAKSGAYQQLFESQLMA